MYNQIDFIRLGSWASYDIDYRFRLSDDIWLLCFVTFGHSSTDMFRAVETFSVLLPIQGIY